MSLNLSVEITQFSFRFIVGIYPALNTTNVSWDREVPDTHDIMTQQKECREQKSILNEKHSYDSSQQVDDNEGSQGQEMNLHSWNRVRPGRDIEDKLR